MIASPFGVILQGRLNSRTTLMLSVDQFIIEES